MVNEPHGGAVYNTALLLEPGGVSAGIREKETWVERRRSLVEKDWRSWSRGAKGAYSGGAGRKPQEGTGGGDEGV